DRIESIDERLERVVLQEERDARLADLVEARRDLALEHRDRMDVDAAQVLQRDERSALAAQRGERAEVVLDDVQIVGANLREQLLLRGVGLLELLARLLLDRFDLVELVED